MNPFRYLLPALLQMLTLSAMGQTNLDSLLRIVHENKQDKAEAMALNELGANVVRNDPQQAKTYFHQSVDLCLHANFPIQLGNAYSQLTTTSQDLGQLDSATYYLELLKKLYESAPVIRPNFVQTAGLFYKRQRNIKKALPYLLEALDMTMAAAKTDSSVQKRTAVAGQMLNVGNAYIELGEYRTAMRYHLDALRSFEAVGNKRGISFCYQMIGSDFLTLHQLTPAMVYTRRALALKAELNDERGIATSLKQIGSIHHYAKLRDSAATYLKQSLKIEQKMGMKQEELDLDLDLGNLYQELDSLAAAKMYFQNGRTLALREGDSSRAATFEAGLIAVQKTEIKQQAKEKKLISSLNTSVEGGDKPAELLNYNYLSEYYTATGQTQKAVKYLREYYEMTDSLQSLNVQVQLKKMESQYNVEKKEQEIALLKKDQQLSHLNLEKQKIALEKQRAFQYGAIILVFFLVLIGFLVINRNRIVHRARRAIEMEKMRNLIARDLHDDIGSTLTSIHIMSNVALHSPDTQEASLQKIRDRSSAIIEKMDDIVWTINPRNDTMEQLFYRMQEFAAEILEPLNINYSFEEKGDLSGMKLDIRKRKDLYLLFKEAVHNAAKYSECSNLSIRLWQEGDSLQMEIADDGKGFSEEWVKGGNGLHNMRERASSLVAKIRIDSAIGQGTRIGIDLPIT